MNTPDFLIAAASADVAGRLALLLAMNGRRARIYPLDSLATRVARIEDPAELDTLVDEISSVLPEFNALILMPSVQSGAGLHDAAEEAGAVLTACFALMKAALARFEATATPGRLISVLPVDAAMGDPGDPANSAAAGGMLSLFRTVSMELKRLPVTANTIVVPALEDGGQAVEGGAAMIRALCASDAQQVNGQEIYAAGAADVGRLHP